MIGNWKLLLGVQRQILPEERVQLFAVELSNLDVGGGRGVCTGHSKSVGIRLISATRASSFSPNARLETSVVLILSK